MTRLADEAILIGKDIRITVMAVNGKKVVLGVEAPREMLILREELKDRTRRDRK